MWIQEILFRRTETMSTIWNSLTVKFRARSEFKVINKTIQNELVQFQNRLRCSNYSISSRMKIEKHKKCIKLISLWKWREKPKKLRRKRISLNNNICCCNVKYPTILPKCHPNQIRSFYCLISINTHAANALLCWIIILEMMLRLMNNIQ